MMKETTDSNEAINTINLRLGQIEETLEEMMGWIQETLWKVNTAVALIAEGKHREADN